MGPQPRPGAISRCFRTETSIRHQSPLIFPEPPSLQHDEYKNCWVIDKTGPAEPCEARTEDLFCISIISPSSITLSLSFWQHWISGAFLVLITGIYYWYLAERSKIEARPGLFSTCFKICMGLRIESFNSFKSYPMCRCWLFIYYTTSNYTKEIN